jgi:O-methyltransferase
MPSNLSSSSVRPLAKLRGLTLGRVRNAATKWSLSSCARQVMREGLTYLTPQKLRVIERAVRRVRRKGVRGDFLECGVALGGSAILLSSLLGDQRRFHGYDVFEMIPPPGPQDESDAHRRYEVIKSGASTGIAGHEYYGYLKNLRDVVVDNFRRYDLAVDDRRIFLHRGLFQDTLHFDAGAHVAFAHIDCDWYEPVKLCLERIYPHLAVGGCMILDDYNDYQGCRKAVDEFLVGKADLVMVRSSPNALIRRLGATARRM